MTHEQDYDELFQSPNYAKLKEHAEKLRRTLEGHAVTLMGPNSPFWRCSYCSAIESTPVHFRHTRECILNSDKTT